MQWCCFSHHDSYIRNQNFNVVCRIIYELSNLYFTSNSYFKSVYWQFKNELDGFLQQLNKRIMKLFYFQWVEMQIKWGDNFHCYVASFDHLDYYQIVKIVFLHVRLCWRSKNGKVFFRARIMPTHVYEKQILPTGMHRFVCQRSLKSCKKCDQRQEQEAIFFTMLLHILAFFGRLSNYCF